MIKYNKTISFSKVFGFKFLASSCLKLCQDCLIFVGPYFLDKLIKFIKNDKENIQIGIFYAILLFSSAMIQSLVLQHYFNRLFIFSARIRTSLMNLIYQKSLRLTTISRKASSVGEITNLMSVNTQNIADLCLFLNVLWSAPFQIIVTLIYLWQYLGVGAIAGFFTMLLFIPLNIYIGNKTKEIQVRKLNVQDKRIKMTNEILNGIKVIKLYGWELSFIDIISKIRSIEMKEYKNKSILAIFSMFTWFTVPFLVSCVSFTTFILVSDDNKLDTETAFVSLSLFNIIRFPLAMLPGVIASLIEASVAIRRITTFLLNDEINNKDIVYNDYQTTSHDTAIQVDYSQLGWSNDEISVTIPSINIKKKELIAIVGPVGSGKSSMLSGLLGEMCKIKGTININGETAFVPQQAWIQNATVRDNILFGRDDNEMAYNEIVKACSLLKDFEIMAAGDQTEIGEKGINLSGGQKQRISLARSVYSNADIYMLDDPLSAVDAHVGKYIFDNVIGPKGMLREKTRLFVTNNLSFLPQVDKILMIENGEIVEIGSYLDLTQNKHGKFSVFIQKYLESNETNKDNIKKNMSQNVLAINNDLVPSTKIPLKNCDKDNLEMKQTELDKQKMKDAGTKIIVKENIQSGNVKFRIVMKFFQTCGFILTFFGLLFSIFSSTAQIATNLWLSDWSNEMNTLRKGETAEETSKVYRLLVYGLIGLLQSLFFIFSEVFFLIAFIRAAKMFHNSMLYSVMRSTLEFFESTPTGRILNRFSKDIDASENSIPASFKMLLRCFLVVLSTIIVISVSTPLFLVALVPIIIIYIFVQRYFVATMRQIKRIEATTRSPIYSQFSETLTGISTIRAYRAQNRFITRFESLIDNNLTYYYPTDFCNRWLAIRLEAMGNLITICAALFAVLSRESISPGIAALSITYSLNITQTLNWLVRMSAEFESNITSIERIQEYCEDIPAEKEWETSDPSEKPDSEWPSSGNIQFNDWGVKYRKDLDFVLRCITIDIKPGERIGIVGRTGAGKSSLTLGLFRILENSTGKITIDGKDINKIGLHNLRHKIAIIPQDPVIFSGKIRTNLDPFNTFDDQKLWMACEQAHLKDFILSLDGQLDFECSEGGENLSVGQRQLICLARALLRKTKILVLDEATASVDHNTDDLIQKTINVAFANCTVLTIAHRLNTIMDSSRVMVLDKGQVIEFDSPNELLKNKQSHFYSMAQHAGLV
jgi:ATP-binding cassette, subfamily C (CFTR/MRP), member 1